MAKVFVVTGASKGLGMAVARHLLQQSHRVVIAARSREPLEKLSKSHPGLVEFVVGDMTDSHMPQDLASRAIDSFGRIDGVVLSHGTLDPSLIDTSTIDTWKRLYDVNVFSCLATAKACLGELRKTKGCVVWVSSGAANKPYKAWAAYGSSKAAVNSISAQLAAEEPDVTSIAVSPGRIDTDMQATVRASGAVMDKAQHESFVEAHRQGTLVKPEQPGNVIARLVAEPHPQLSGAFVKWVLPWRMMLSDAADIPRRVQLELGGTGRLPAVVNPVTQFALAQNSSNDLTKQVKDVIFAKSVER